MSKDINCGCGKDVSLFEKDQTEGLGLNRCVALRKPALSLLKKKSASICHIGTFGKKVMWSDEPRFALFQSDERISVRREAEEVPSVVI